MRTRLWLGLGLALAASVDARSTRTEPEARWQAWEQHQALQQSSWFGGLKWRPIGPTVQGGRVVDIEVHPGHPYTFYVAYASGGVWKTRNNGVSFEPLSDGLPTMISGDIAIDPQAPETLWVGTGEPNSSRSSYSGLGVFVSRDGGQHFEHAGLTGADRIARIKVDPSDSQRVYVAVHGPLYTAGGMRGIYRTLDGGRSWQQVLAGPNDWTGASDLVLDPSDPKTMYAAMWDRKRRPWDFVDAGVGSSVYKSSDGGETWTRLAQFPQGEHVGRIGLTISAANPRRIYAGIDNQAKLSDSERDPGDSPLSLPRLRTMDKDEFLRQDPESVEGLVRALDMDISISGASLTARIKSGELTMDGLRKRILELDPQAFEPEVRALEVWRSDDAGASWTRVNRDLIRDFTYTYGYYFGEIKAAPDNADRVYVLGLPTAVSEDGGVTWSGRTNAPSVHVDHHAWTIDPQHPERILNGNDGGVDVSYDGGATWLKLDAQAVGQSYAVAVDMDEPYNVYTGLQDNGTWKGSSAIDLDQPGGFWAQNGDGWRFLNGGDGMQIQVDPRDSSVVYTGFQFGNYRRAGKDGGEVRARALWDEPPLRYNWNTPVLLSPHNPDVVYMGANRLYRSMDRGHHFTPISGDLTRGKRDGDVPFATITTVSESPREFGLIAAGSDDGMVWISEDSGQEWREATRGLVRDRWVSRVQFSAHARSRLYLSLNGYRDDDMSAYVYVSEDLGKTWRSIAAGLPAEPVNVVREDPVNADLLYVGTDRGVYVSIDRGQSWQALQAGLPNVPVHDLVVHPRDRELVAGTHGRSVWIVDVLPLQDLTADVRAKAAHWFYVADVDYDRSWRSRPDRWFGHNECPAKAVLTYWAAEAGKGTLKVLDSKKNLVREIPIEAARGINRYEYDLKVDAELGVAAEKARLAEADKDAKEPKDDGALARMPLAEALRLGFPPYITPGDYTLTLDLGGASAEATLKINAPKPSEPRDKPKFKLRGR